MAYRFKSGESVAEGVVRIARRQTDRSLQALGSGSDQDPLAAAFEVRRRCKKVRSVARLVRPLVGSAYDEVNRCYRQAGRLLAGYREPAAQLAALDQLFAAEAQRSTALAALRRQLDDEVTAGRQQLVGDEERLARLDELLRVGRRRLDRWQLSAEGWDAIEPGLARNYRQSRRALAVAVDDPTPYNIHEFRKYAKYLRNHLRLIEPAAPTEIGPQIVDLAELTSTLGLAHDLAQLADRLDHAASDGIRPTDDVEPVNDGSKPTAGDARRTIDARRLALERRGLELGGRLHRETPTELVDRLGRHWAAWHSQQRQA
jgi:CHAD domain-containing protein